MAKEGSTVSGLMDSFATTVSVALQYGVPLKDLVNKFAHVRFEPSGFTGNQEIPIAKSIIDYIFRWLGSRFLSPEDKQNLGLIDRTAVVADVPVSSPGSATVDPVTNTSAAAGVAPSAPVAAPAPEAAKATEPDAPKATAAVAEPVAANDTVYANARLECQGQIRFGPSGRAAAAAVWLVAPCTELFQDQRSDATVDLAIGTEFTELTHSDDIDAVLASLRPDATLAADPALLKKIHTAAC